MDTSLSYDPAVLHRLHTVELSILNDVDALCKTNGIAWFALGGCCIGAFRHGGFVPWDDDIDICMLRADYNKFLKVAASDPAFSEKYRLVIPGKEPNYPCMFAKVSLNGTKNMTAELLEAGCENIGIHMDIFPFDYTPEDDAARQKQEKKAWLYSKLSYIYHLKKPHIPFSGAAGKLFRFACRILHALMHLFRICPARFAEKYHAVCTAHNGTPTDVITDFTYIRPEDATMRVSEVFPVLRVPFEDTEICVPQAYDKIMRQYYGDWMQMPPEDKRKNHPPAVLEFSADQA